MNRRQRGLSMVELLMVVSVVIVLAAIGAVIAPRAMLSAQASACRSNLKQIGAAVMLYAEAHDGRIPHHSWHHLMGPGPEAPERQREHRDALEAFGAKEDIWFCPADPLARTPARGEFTDRMVSSYMISLSALQYGQSSQGGFALALSSVPDPSQEPMFMNDIVNEGDGLEPVLKSPFGDQVNAVMFDGRSVSLPHQEAPAR